MINLYLAFARDYTEPCPIRAISILCAKPFCGNSRESCSPACRTCRITGRHCFVDLRARKTPTLSLVSFSWLGRHWGTPRPDVLYARRAWLHSCLAVFKQFAGCHDCSQPKSRLNWNCTKNDEGSDSVYCYAASIFN